MGDEKRLEVVQIDISFLGFITGFIALVSVRLRRTKTEWLAAIAA